MSAIDSDPRLIAELPDVADATPESGWIHARSVTGPYGITAAVRDFAEVMDWQEHVRELTQGYYRLIHPPQVRRLRLRLEAACPGYRAVLFCSGALAEKEWSDLCLVHNLTAGAPVYSGLPAQLPECDAVICSIDQNGLRLGAVLLRDSELAEELHERNRRRGGAVSTRAAAGLQDPDLFATPDPDVERGCAETLCRLEQADHALFYPSGMAAVTAALTHVLSPEKPHMLVLGNVYRDTHLLLEEQPWAGLDLHCDFLDTDDLAGLRERIHDPRVAGVLVETITNPLIEIPDLPAIASLCREAGVPLLVDSTMAGPLNAAPLTLGANVLIHSTSKYLSGSNSHGGGVILTSEQARADALRDEQKKWEWELSPLDFPSLRDGLQTYPERLERFNRNGEALADLLRQHPAVGRVYFANRGRPDWLKGLAGVVSCELSQPSMEKVAKFFDAPLPGVHKAPSLGSDETLFCPYVLLAYYDKSDDYLADCNLSKTLLRFACGCEPDFTPVLEGIRKALDETLTL